MIKTYYELLEEQEYRILFQYKADEIGDDEWYARQLCLYHIMNGTQYCTIANEMSDTEEMIIVQSMGLDKGHDESGPIFSTGICVEFRDSNEDGNFKYLERVPVQSHFDVLRYLTKDVVQVPKHGQRLITSRELDQDRGVYVIYTKEL